ncbi:hypothetical protein AU252_00795 [Pseudarthrobacter sulfonivorans]|uniref:SMP-30/Gluconolactonase/LRE-like region domain-containing protein n=1 Tax=Pseudarthrobacter sulfonivorans TaxID=121292 RepID=A0A0U3FLU6_9MICC|nr:SMP-30/gluconolactonase/LRE family protein [Pseudarthrobacter sulfonivorans]ALV39879.1 hypothetical protein AU252_00795 [Pseudarthrobacter sulfonivorans]
MTESRLNPVLGGWSFLEGIRWHDGRLWVSDFYTRTVICSNASGTQLETTLIPDQPSGLGWLPDGRLLVAGQLERKIFRVEPTGKVVVHADLSDLVSGHLNDMFVDQSGRAYVGEFGFDLHRGETPRPGNLIRVDTDGQATVAASDLWFPNGIVAADSGNTLIVAESMANRLTAFAVGEDGSLNGRSTWASYGPPPPTGDVATLLATTDVAPDGIAVDAEGAVWAADPSHNRVVRISRGGQITDEISTGDLGPYSCVLGGADGRTLYICASPSFLEHECRDTRNAVVLATEVEVAGW